MIGEIVTSVISEVVQSVSAGVEAIGEGIGQSAELASTEVSEGIGEIYDINEVTEFSIPQESDFLTEVREGDFTREFIEKTSDKTSVEGIKEIRSEYENVDKVLTSIENDIKEAETNIDLQRQLKRIETYKGTVFEDICKESLKEKFDSVDTKQISIETEEGVTKPDLVLREAKEDFKLGNVEINKGETLYAEVKCGSAEYIESEMKHINMQVLGHNEGKSIVIVSKDYLEIDPQKRAYFEASLRERGSDIIVSDVYGDDVENAIISSLKI